MKKLGRPASKSCAIEPRFYVFFSTKNCTLDEKIDSNNGVFVYFEKIIKNGSNSNFRILKKITGRKLTY